MDPQSIRLKIAIHYVTSSGECIMLCGSHKKLGEWNPLKSLRLEFRSGFYWYLDVSFPMDSPSFECKFVLCKENENKLPFEVLRWEESQNRKMIFNQLFVEEGVHLRRDFWEYPTSSMQGENVASHREKLFLHEELVIVKGYVVDNKINPINLANVSIEGASLTTSSGNNGFFECRIPKEFLLKVLDEKEEICLKATNFKYIPSQKNISLKFIEKEAIFFTLLKYEEVSIVAQEIKKIKGDIVQEVVLKSKKSQVTTSERIPEKDNPLPTLTLEALDSVKPTAREEVLKTICIKLDEESLKTPLPPKENSLALDNSNKNQELLSALHDVKTSEQFLETTEPEEMQDITKQLNA